MNQILRPYELHYLRSPFFCKGEDLLEYVVMDLCLRNVLQHEDRWVYITPREPRPLLRTFLRRGPHFATGLFTLPEQFFLDLFEHQEELSISQIIGIVADRIDENPAVFKTDYVYKDMNHRDLCMLFYMSTIEGERRLKMAEEKMDRVKDLLELPESRRPVEQISRLCIDIGTNLILMEEETLEKLRHLDLEKALPPELNLVFNLSASFSMRSSAAFSGGMSGGGFGIGFGGGFGSGGSSFGGFGGGSFGGGGSSGSW